MSHVTAAADEGHVPQHTLDLPGLLLVIGTEAFVAALVLLVGEPWVAWYLFLVPITLAALRLGAAGALVAWASSAGIVVLATPRELMRDDWPTYAVCLAAYLVTALMTGVRARQLERRCIALESTSPLDPVTGVLRPDAFLARVAAELSRAERYAHPVGCAAVRVDGFDEFVRVFGRYKAEAMLEHLASVVRLEVRSTDPVGRLGHDGFVVALPYADEREAADVALRLAGTVAHTGFEGDALEPVVSRTATTASVAYPADADDAPGLLAALSRALDHDDTLPKDRVEAGGLP